MYHVASKINFLKLQVQYLATFLDPSIKFVPPMLWCVHIFSSYVLCFDLCLFNPNITHLFVTRFYFSSNLHLDQDSARKRPPLRIFRGYCCWSRVWRHNWWTPDHTSGHRLRLWHQVGNVAMLNAGSGSDSSVVWTSGQWSKDCQLTVRSNNCPCVVAFLGKIFCAYFWLGRSGPP